MPCGCGGSAPASPAYEYVYVAPEGDETIYTNEYEARAQVINNGGSWRPQLKDAEKTSFSGTVSGKSGTKI